MRVIVAEKPSVARDLARVLGATNRRNGYLEGNGLQVTWCIGHICELQDPAHYDAAWKQWRADTLPMVPETFDLRVRKGVADQWKVLRTLLTSRDTEDVVNACDAGREGELIFRYVYQLAGARKPTLRLWVSSMTDAAIKQAWGQLQPGARFDRLADAARCRSESDWLVGLNATRAMTCLARSGGGEQLLSVGRVQTPTLAMIVARDRAIDAFVPQTFWQVKADFAADAGAWTGTWFRPGVDDKKDKKDADAPKAERLLVEADAVAIADATRGQTGTVQQSDQKRTRERPPLLYDLTALQRRANQRYGLSAQRTLQVAQDLYEKHKLLTYPRTDARYLTPAEVPTLPAAVQAVGSLAPYAPFAQAILANPINPGTRVVNAAEVGDHHAILPTSKPPNASRLSADEKRVYDLVARRLLAVLSADALFDVTTLVVEVPPNGPLPADVDAPLLYRARGRICVQEGWRAVDPPASRRRSVDLPAVPQGAPAVANEVSVHEGQTRPPRPFNDASILQAMETAGKQLTDAELKRALRNAGLGTPATRAAILQTLLDRGFVVRQKKDLRATPKGCSLIDAVPTPELKSAELTARWEARLAAMADSGRAGDRAVFMADAVAHVTDICAAIAGADPPPPEVRDRGPVKALGDCPICGEVVAERGPVYTCATGRACDFVVFKTMSKRAISAKMVRDLLKNGKSAVVKGFKSKKGNEFSAALSLDDAGRVTFAFPPRVREGDSCPKCKQGNVMRGRTRFGCTRWRDGCDWRADFPSYNRASSQGRATSATGSR